MSLLHVVLTQTPHLLSHVFTHAGLPNNALHSSCYSMCKVLESTELGLPQIQLYNFIAPDDIFLQVDVPSYEVGDVVRVIDAMAETYRLQQGHGEWIDDMALVHYLFQQGLVLVIQSGGMQQTV